MDGAQLESRVLLGNKGEYVITWTSIGYTNPKVAIIAAKDRDKYFHVENGWNAEEIEKILEMKSGETVFVGDDESGRNIIVTIL